MIKQGGYAKGFDYRYYREHGWGAVRAVWMTVPTIWKFILAIVVGIIVGRLMS